MSNLSPLVIMFFVHTVTPKHMKPTVALLSAKIATLAAKNCNAPPDLGKGVWNCPSEVFWNHGDVCRISGDDCNGTVKCWKSNWKGNTSKFCPKDCQGYPKQPAFGGSFECADERDWRTCELKVWDGFKCSSSVKCNTQKGAWTGKTILILLSTRVHVVKRFDARWLTEG